MRAKRYAIWGLVFLSVIVGCGRKETVTWRGEVTFEGSPVEGGTVRFEPVGGKGQTAGASIVQGKYSVELIPGTYNVVITGNRQAGVRPAYAGSDETVPVVEVIGTYRETVEVNADQERNFSIPKQ